MPTENQERILVIEDDQKLAKLLKARLELSGYQVQTEGCGAAGLSTVAETPPDLVILDLKLPDMHGYDVCRKLRQSFHPWALPVLILTGLDRPVDRLRGFAFGADAFLTKPFESDELMKTIAYLLGHPHSEPSSPSAS